MNPGGIIPSPGEEKFLVLLLGDSILGIRLEKLGSDYGNWNPRKSNDLKRPSLANNTVFEGLSPYYQFVIGVVVERCGCRVVTSKGDGDYAVICPPFSTHKLVSVHTALIPKLKTEKAKPIIESIEGKLLVHESTGVFKSGWDNPHPVFSVCDFANENWKNVDVPYAIEFNGSINLPPYTALGCFVIGSKLFIPSDVKKLYCFDVNTMEWDSKSCSNLIKSFNEAGFVQGPMFGRCVSVPGFEDNSSSVMVCLQDFGPLKAQKPYAHLIGETGILLCHQDLSKVQNLFNDVLPYVAPAVESRFIDLGSGKVCAILYGRDKGKTDFVLHICIFELQKLPGAVYDICLNYPTSPPGEKEFVSVKILNKYFCKLTELVECKPSPLINAFFS